MLFDRGGERGEGKYLAGNLLHRMRRKREKI